MTTSTPSLSPGLEGVPIAESAISLVEGLAGRLSYRGYSIEDITHAENTFEEIVALIYDGELPKRARVDEVRRQLEAGRTLAPAQIEIARAAAKVTHPMFALQAAATLGPMDNDFEPKVATVEARGLSAVAKMGHLVGVLAQAVDARPYEGPRAGESHAQMMARLARGSSPGVCLGPSLLQKQPRRRLPCRLVREGVMSQDRRRQFVIDSAKALGLTIPQTVLLRADRVIE